MTIISSKPLLRKFRPHIHSCFLTHIFSTNESHPRSCLNRATWEHEKKSWEHCKKFLGTKIYLHGSKQPKETIPRNFSWNQIFLHGIKHRLPQCSQEHSQESKPQVPGTCVQPAKGQGGGWKLPGGPLDNQGVSYDSECLSWLFGNVGSFSSTCSIPNSNHFTTNMLMQNSIVIMPVRR